MISRILKRIGIMYFSAGRRINVEINMSGKSIGSTTHDVTTGQQTFWFESYEQFAQYAKQIWECVNRNSHNVPVPVLQFEDGETVTASPEIALLQARVQELESLLAAQNTPNTYKDRLIAETAQVAERLGRLEAFLKGPAFDSIGQAQKDLLVEQADAMRAYSSVLAKRLALVKPEAPAVDIWEVVGTRNVRLPDLAKELNLTEKEARALVEANPNMAPINRGWVKRNVPEATETEEPKAETPEAPKDEPKDDAAEADAPKVETSEETTTG